MRMFRQPTHRPVVFDNLESRQLLSTAFLSDSFWSAGGANGWGQIEFDQSNGESAPNDGHTITLNGQTYDKGLGVHATSDASWNVVAGDGYTNFRADVGVDDEVGSNGSVVFQVWFDDEKLFDSGVMTGTSATKPVDVNIANRTGQLRLLVTDAGNGNTFDHADWASARFVGDRPQEVTPTVTLAPVNGTPTEGGSFETYRLTRAGSLTNALTVHFTTGGVATRGEDYEIRDTANTVISGDSLTIPAGADSVDFRVTGLQDTTPEPAESYSVTIGTGTGYELGAPNSVNDYVLDDDLAPQGVVYASDLILSSSTNGWGPVERDQSNGEQRPADGHAITIGGTVFQKGFGVHADSELVANVGGRYTSFQSVVGLDDEVGNNGSVVFQVWGDDVKLYDSGKVVGSDAGKAIDVDIAGVSSLRLVVTDAGDGNTFDHADWGDAKLTEAENGAPYVVSMTNKTVFEGDRDRIVFEVRADGTGPEPLEFDYETYDITAKAGEDYEPVSGHLVVQPDTGVRQYPIFIQTLTDDVPESNETFGMRIFNVVGNARIEPGGGIMTIRTQLQQPVSALTPASPSNGWGPYEKDTSNGEAAAGDGKPIMLQQALYSVGLGVHANSDLSFNIADKGFTQFQSAIGIDDEVGNNGSVVFQVYLDGLKKYDSGVMTGSSATRDVSVDVTGASTLQLVVTDAGDGNTFDHADWASPTLS
jgi:hypothetical protein